MIHEYQLQEEDYLAFQLFASSQSERVNRKKRTGGVFLLVAALVSGAAFWAAGNEILAIYCGVVALAVALFGGRYFRWRYKRHYVKYIRENYSSRFGEGESIEFLPDIVVTKDKTGESKINVSEFETIFETGQHFFMKITNGMSLIIPKAAIKDLEGLRTDFETMGTPQKVDLDWKWK